MTACDIETSFGFDKTVWITSHLRFPIHPSKYQPAPVELTLEFDALTILDYARITQLMYQSFFATQAAEQTNKHRNN